MAIKKKKTTKRRPRAKSRMGDRRTTKRRGRKRARRGKGLSDMFTPGGFKRGLRTTLAGGGGGVIELGIDLLTGDSEIAKGLITVAASLASSAMSGAKRIGEDVAAGMMGAYVSKGLTRWGKSAGLLSDDFDDNNYANQDVMSDYPDALTEGGKPLYLAEDGNLYLSDEFFQQPDGTFVLSDAATPYNSNMAVANY